MKKKWLSLLMSLTLLMGSIPTLAVSGAPGEIVNTADASAATEITETSDATDTDVGADDLAANAEDIAADFERNLAQFETQAASGGGYGGNGKFLAPIDPPDPNAIPIYTAQDLDNMRNNMSGSYVLMNDIDLSEFNGGEWEPIGDEFWIDGQTLSTQPFRGIFDGQGHVMRNLKITGKDEVYYGLFGYTIGSEIKNVGLEGTYIDITYSGYNAHSTYVGGIAGDSESSNINNCYNTGNISTASSAAVSNVGGITGASDIDSNISNCYNTGDISANAYGFSGGITGYGGSSNISNCYNTGNISAAFGAGGIAGEGRSSNISNCYNTGDVSVSASGFAGAGGITGYGDSSNISNCYNTGDVSASGFIMTSSYGSVGGITGDGPFSNISNCYNTGDISASAPAPVSGYVSGYVYTGGIAGYGGEYFNINNCVVIATSIYAESTNETGRIYSYLIGHTEQGQKSDNLAVSGIAGNAIDDTGDGSGGALISLDQARSQSTYEALGWDFDTVWEMVPGYDYPQLRGLGSGGVEPGVNHTITASAGAGGSVSPSGAVTVPDGGAQTFVITAGDGYRISDVLAEGVSVGAVGSYTFENVTGDHSIEAIFAASGPSGGNGKFLAPIGPPDPNATPIYTAQDLDSVRNNLSGSYVLMNDIDLSGFNGGEWIPIGNGQSYGFTGVFDGQGHVVRNLRITGEGYQWYNGLFGHTVEANIKNVGLEGTYIEISSSSWWPYVGGIAGYSDSDCIISNCYNTGNISSHSSNSNVGGITGRLESVSISNCYNTGNISSYSSNSMVGGITGYSNSASVSNCYNTGEITSNASDTVSRAGGITGGCVLSSMRDCYNTGNITASTSSSSSVYTSSSAAGIAALLGIDGESSISNCYSTGYISSSSFSSAAAMYPSDAYAGGIAAIDSTDSPSLGFALNITNCLALPASINVANGEEKYVYYIGGYPSAEIQKSNNLALSGIAGNAVNDADRLISAAEARSQSTYEALGWDFVTVWEMVPGYDYPRLRGQYSGGAVEPGVSHTITATAGAGGSISPSGAVTVPDGGAQTFTITAGDGYRISDVLADGVSVGAAESYTFENVTGDHRVEAVFAVSGGAAGETEITGFELNSTLYDDNMFGEAGEPIHILLTGSAGADVSVQFVYDKRGENDLEETVSLTETGVGLYTGDFIVPQGSLRIWEATATLENKTTHESVSEPYIGVIDETLFLPLEIGGVFTVNLPSAAPAELSAVITYRSSQTTKSVPFGEGSSVVFHGLNPTDRYDITLLLSGSKRALLNYSGLSAAAGENTPIDVNELPAPTTLTVNVHDPEGSRMTDGFRLRYSYESDGAFVHLGDGGAVYGVLLGDTVKAALSWSDDYSGIYKNQEYIFNVSDMNPVETITAESIETVTLSGSAADKSDGAPLENVQVTFTQDYQNNNKLFTDSLFTGAAGEWSFTITKGVDARVEFNFADYNKKQVTVSADDLNGDYNMGVIELEHVSARVTLSASYQRAKANVDDAPVYNPLDSFRVTEITNITTGGAVTFSGGSHGVYNLTGGVAAGDEICVTATGQDMISGQVTLTLDDYAMGDASLLLLEKGVLSANILDPADRYITVRVYGADGRRAYHGDVNQRLRLDSGSYTAVFMLGGGYAPDTLGAFQSRGIAPEAFVSKAVSITDNLLTVVDVSGLTVEVDSDGNPVSPPEESRLKTANYTARIIGSQIHLRAEYAFIDGVVPEHVSVALGIPAGTIFARNSLTVSQNGKETALPDPAGADTVTAENLAAAGVARFVATANTGGRVYSDAYVTYTLEGETYTEKIGSTNVGVPITLAEDAASPEPTVILYAQELVDRDRFIVKGKAKPGERILIYDGDYIIGQGKANMVGSFAAAVKLVSADYPSSHTLTAQTDSGISEEKTVLYRKDTPILTSVTFYQPNHGTPRTTVDDPGVELLRVPLVYWPGHTFVFEIGFSRGADAIEDVQVYSESDKDSIVLEAAYDYELGKWVALGILSDGSVPGAITVEYTPKEEDE